MLRIEMRVWRLIPRQVWSVGRGTGLVLSLLLGLQLMTYPFFAGVPVQAQESGNRAGLVVVHADGRVTTRCVAFEEPAITGYTLLQRSGLAFITASGPMGIRVCSVDGEGCPAADCWCLCKSAPCAYWNYYHGNPDGSWSYAQIGAVARSIGPGDVDGWMWGDGSGAPPTISFSTICAGAEAGATLPEVAPTETQALPSPAVPATDAPTATVPPAVEPTPTVESTPTVVLTPTVAHAPESQPTASPTSERSTPAVTPTATASSTPAVTVTSTAPGTATLTSTPSGEGTANAGSGDEPNATGGYLAFVAIVAVLGGVFYVVRHRQGG